MRAGRAAARVGGAVVETAAAAVRIASPEVSAVAEAIDEARADRARRRRAGDDDGSDGGGDTGANSDNIARSMRRARQLRRQQEEGDIMEEASAGSETIAKLRTTFGVLAVPWRLIREMWRGCIGSIWREGGSIAFRNRQSHFQAGIWHGKRLPPQVPPKDICLLCCLLSNVIYYYTEDGFIDKYGDIVQLDKEGDASCGDTQYEMLVAATRGAESSGGDENATQAPQQQRASTRREPSGSPPSLLGADDHPTQECTARRLRNFARGFDVEPLSTIAYTVLPALENWQRHVADRAWYVATAKSVKDETDTNALIVTSHALRAIMVVFRGTDSAANLRVDVSALKTGVANRRGSKGPRVHEGFHRAYYFGGVAKELELRISELTTQNPEFDLYLMGHSLGGALATILAYRLLRLAIIPEEMHVNLFTFGAPRVGSPDFVSELDSFSQLRGFRFVHRGDVVPRLPMINYQHHGTLIWLRDRPQNRVEVYARGIDAPWRQTCLCANLNVAAHSVVRQVGGRTSDDGDHAGQGPQQHGASTPISPPRLGVGLTGLLLPECCMQRADAADDAENFEFRGYLAAIHRVPEDEVRARL